VSDLYEILRNINNPIVLGKKKDFKSYGIDIKFEEPALQKIAEYAHQEKTGARGLVSAVEKGTLVFEKKLPSTNIKQLVVTPELVDSPEEELKRLLDEPENREREARFTRASEAEAQRLKDSIHRRKGEFLDKYGVALNDEIIDLITYLVMDKTISASAAYEQTILIRRAVENFEDQFYEKHGLRISFADDALNGVIHQTIVENGDPLEICRNAVKNYEYGLELIKEKTGKDTFTIHREALDDSEGYLNRLIRNSYK